MPEQATDAPGVPSPCTSVCTMDGATGWCIGCLRTIDEIAAWGMLDDGAKRAVLAALPARRLALKERSDAER